MPFAGRLTSDKSDGTGSQDASQDKPAGPWDACFSPLHIFLFACINMPASQSKVKGPFIQKPNCVGALYPISWAWPCLTPVDKKIDLQRGQLHAEPQSHNLIPQCQGHGAEGHGPQDSCHTYLDL